MWEELSWLLDDEYCPWYNPHSLPAVSSGRESARMDNAVKAEAIMHVRWPPLLEDKRRR
jgi:hypothetical protein